MTVDEYYGQLRDNGFTVMRRIDIGGTVTLILQGREPGEIVTIMAPEDQTPEQRAETMSGFLRRYVL